MDLGIQHEPTTEALPRVTFRWDAETEILTGRFTPPSGGRGFTGAVEFEGPDGAVLTMDVEQGVVCGVEVVVWPVSTREDGLAPPSATPGRVLIPARPSQPGVGAVEVETPLAVRTGADHRVIHLRVGRGRAALATRIAENLIVELDSDRAIAGFWLLDVPPFPEEGDA